MRKMIFFLCTMCVSLCFSLCGCGRAEDMVQKGLEGRIGDEEAVSRELAAKMMTLAFHTPQELKKMEQKANFPDVDVSHWAYPYINGAVSMGILSGDEDGNFHPEADLTLTQAQFLMDRLAPDFDSKIVLTEENKNMAVSYSLWVQLLQTALEERQGREGLDTYGIVKRNAVLLERREDKGVFDTGRYGMAGMELLPFEGEKISFLEKDGEILALLSVKDITPTIENIYCRQEKGQVLLETGEDTLTYPYSEKSVSGICDVDFAEGEITDIRPAKKMGQQTVKRVNKQEIYLAEQGLLPWDENFRIYDGTKGIYSKKTSSALICGTDNAVYYEKDGKVCGAVITKREQPKNVRVLVGGAGQKKVALSASDGFSLKSTSTEKSFSTQIALTPEMPWFDNGIVTVSAEGQKPIEVAFSDGTTRSYYGILELERRTDGITVINELPMETYLKGVVPHEMPVHFGEIPLEAQAISARSYTYNRFYANAYCGYGAHLDDTVASQVYLGADTDPLSDKAVDDTKGFCVTHENEVVSTYFYSTSCGFGASAKDVWSKDGIFTEEEKPYLQGSAHGIQTEEPQSEEEWLEFWQDTDTHGYDKESPWYRWKVYFGAGQLGEITEKKLQEAVKATPNVVEVQKEDGTWQQGSVENMGKLKGISVVERGKGGVIKVLQLDYEHISVRIKGEYAIRKILSPKKMTKGDPIYLQRNDGESLTETTVLPSGFFAAKEMRNQEGMLTGVALYGGGSGHGVGMSQYGAKGMAAEGKSAEEILAHYFPGTAVECVM